MELSLLQRSLNNYGMKGGCKHFKKALGVQKCASNSSQIRFDTARELA